MRETFVAICLVACFFAADLHREKCNRPSYKCLMLEGQYLIFVMTISF